MSDKAILITGGAKRVGAALCRHFAKAGYDIALHYNHSKADAVQLSQDLAVLGVKVELFQQDLTNVAGIHTLMQTVHKAMPHTVALVNNASVFERAFLMDTDEALFDRQLDTNLKAPFFLTQAFAKIFKKGAVVNVCDSDIGKTRESHFAYILSKKALAELTHMAARELGPNVRVNAVCPGGMLPADDGFDAAYIEKLRDTLPLQRTPEVGDMAHAVQFLCENPALTGQLLYIDGGQHVL